MEPLAIIGLACRFPGAPDPDSYWRLLRDGVDAIAEVPPDRWDIEALYDPDPAAPGKMTSRWGGFLENIDGFDPRFFGIAPREAASMDPQQRLMLEVTWEALENAGIRPEQLAGTETGVFIGICSFDYSWRRAGDLNLAEAHSGTGIAHSITPNRISYLLDLHGPSLALDTACSSSLVAVHLACQSIWRGESSMALAGGVNVIASPELSIAFSKARMLSPDGRCKTFDAAADGYVRGEGCGLVVIKPLADARRDGDSILALVRGTATNQDGRSNGLTAPNGPAQQAVVRQAIEQAGLAPADIGFVEAHGTGTPVGDPIELQALANVLGPGRTPDDVCVVGSTKANIGHLEGAAGVAGVIKAVLCLQNGEIPPQLHFRKLNPMVKPGKLPLVIPTERYPWPAGPKPRYVGINSFGFGGANAHVVLEEAPSVEQPTEVPAERERPVHLLTASARSEAALKERAERWARWLEAEPAASLADVCFSANTRRSQFEHRLAVAAGSIEQLREGLEAFAAGNKAAGLVSGTASGRGGEKVAFLFTGQGAQYAGMGQQLYETQPTFRRTVDRCAELVGPYLEQPLLEVLFPPPGVASPINETAYTQPALFTIEYALAELWRSWGVEPELMVGHSIGEFAAACIAGVFSLEDGLRLVAERGRLMQALPRDGSMAAVLADEVRIEAAAAPYADKVSIAAINGPGNLVISGLAVAVEAIVEQLRAEGIACQPLTISHAFHSPLTEPMLDEFERTASELRYAAPTIPIVSNLTGSLLPPGQAPDAAYWRRHARGAVRFADGVQRLAEQGCTVAIEMGPQPVLVRMAQRGGAAGVECWLGSLQRDREDWSVLLESLGTLYTRGFEPNWQAFERDYGPRRRVSLPTYPFERERYWVGREQPAWDQTAMLPSANGQATKGHPLLGRRLQAAHGMFETNLSLTAQTYLADHRVRGATLLPGTAFVELAAAAASEVLGTEACVLADVAFRRALPMPEREHQQFQVILSPNGSSESAFHVYSRPGLANPLTTPWTLHATGKVRPSPANEPAPTVDLAGLIEEAQARCPEKPAEEHYADLEIRGYQYGPSFRGIEQLWRRDGEALGRIVAPPEIASELERYLLHPALLDAAGHAMTAMIPLEDTFGTLQDTFVPVSIDRIRVYGRLSRELWCHARLTHYGGRSGNVAEGDCVLVDEAGRVVVELTGFRSERLQYGSLAATAERTEDWLYEITWRPTPPPAALDAPAEPGSWLVFVDESGVGQTVAAHLAERGETLTLVSPGEAYERLDPDHYRVDPARPEDLRRLLEDLSGPGRPAWRGFVHCWSLDLPDSEATTPAALERATLLGCGSVLHLVQALAGLGGGLDARLWLVTRAAQAVGEPRHPVAVAQAPLWGLGRVVAHELPDLRCTSVDLGPDGSGAEVEALLRELSADDPENEIALRGDVRYVARLVRFAVDTPTTPADDTGGRQSLGSGSSAPGGRVGNPPLREHGGPSVGTGFQPALALQDSDGHPDDAVRTAEPPPAAAGLPLPADRPFRLEIGRPGLIDLAARPAARRAPGPGQVEIRVRAAGLNFRDVMKALGLYPSDSDEVQWLGDECAGAVVALGEGVEGLQVGDEVVAIAPACFGSFATTNAAFVVPKPAALSFEEAASLPIAFTTALYALRDLGRLARGERVLIHAAAGGVGLAAVQVAQWLGAEIYATAGSPEKHDYLHSIGVEHVMSSRSLAFADEVLELTGGRGVDVVLNSLAGAAIPRGIASLAPYGRFLEIGKRDIYENSKLGLRPLQNNLSFFAIDMEGYFRQRTELAGALLREVMQLFADGVFSPLPHEPFSVEQATGAFRHMARARHIGKIVLTFPETTLVEETPTESGATFRSDASYLITGGLGGLGLTVARWLVERGARHLVLMGRRGPSAEAQRTLDELAVAGARVEIVQADIAQEAQVAEALNQIAQTMLPLRGIVHAAGILDDGILAQLDLARFRSVMAPKVQGAWHLHARTADLALDFFVLFSSTAAVLGPPGQANYVAANTFLDALAHDRRANGRPALSINWGPWAQVGMAAGADRGGRLALRGVGSIDSRQALEILERLLAEEQAQVAVMSIDWQRWSELFPRAAELPLVADLLPGSAAARPAAQDSPGRATLLALEPFERRPRLEAYLQQQVAHVMQLDPARIDIDQPLNMMGLDSLMGIELKNRVEADLAINVPMAALMEGPSIAELAATLLDLVLEAGAPPVAARPAESGVAVLDGQQADQLLTRIDELSDAEVDALLGELMTEETAESR